MQTDTFEVHDYKFAKAQLLIWASQFSSCAFLDNNQYQTQWQRRECLVATGSLHAIQANAGKALEALQQFIDHHAGQWIFGHLGYNLKSEIEMGLNSPLENPVGFNDLHFFVPETVVQLSENSVTISSETISPGVIWEQINACKALYNTKSEVPDFAPCISKLQYLETIEQLKDHIQRGDCYEINFCQEFSADDAVINPAAVYHQLNELSPNPFSGYYRINHAHLICASPERYLMRQYNKLFSQPIKGTAARSPGNAAAEAQQILQLQQDPKERSENVMIVDLVRNDLSRICKEGSVQVEELFGIYTYPNVHQMISTISGEVQADISFADIIRATFPVGSMTGAPKKRVMELIARYECGNRGIFSGSVGYISPGGDFDFNVVIRSLQYNEAANYLSYWVGSGITWYSDPEKEYEECMLKASAIKKVLQTATPFL